MHERLSPLESIMWRVGQDPTLRMTVGALLLLDRPVKEAELVERVVDATKRSPRLQWRPDDPSYARIRPVWVEDDASVVEQHVRSMEVPAPGSVRQVLDLLALLEPLPFDPERSPWDITLLQGVDGDSSALYLRAHHVMTDGLGGIRLIEELFDRPETTAAVSKLEPRKRRARAAAEDDSGPPREWGTVTIDFSRALRSMATGMNAARDVQPVDTVARGLKRAVDIASSVSRQVLVTGGPLAPVPPTHSVLTHFDALSLPHARTTALALGGGRTDVLVTAAAAAMGLYHQRSGTSCPTVRVALPARQPRDGEAGGNWFAPTRVEIPTAIDHPGRQFGVVTERLAQARHEPALQLAAAVASALSLLPNRLLVPAVMAQVDTIDLAVTAVPGLPAGTRICGANVEVAYPLGPRLGVPVNLTAFGNNGGLDIGIALDPGAITDPDAFRDCLREAFAALEREPV